MELKLADNPMIDMARRAYMVKGNKIHQVK